MGHTRVEEHSYGLPQSLSKVLFSIFTGSSKDGGDHIKFIEYSKLGRSIGTIVQSYQNKTVKHSGEKPTNQSTKFKKKKNTLKFNKGKCKFLQWGKNYSWWIPRELWYSSFTH